MSGCARLQAYVIYWQSKKGVNGDGGKPLPCLLAAIYFCGKIGLRKYNDGNCRASIAIILPTTQKLWMGTTTAATPKNSRSGFRSHAEVRVVRRSKKPLGKILRLIFFYEPTMQHPCTRKSKGCTLIWRSGQMATLGWRYIISGRVIIGPRSESSLFLVLLQHSSSLIAALEQPLSSQVLIWYVSSPRKKNPVVFDSPNYEIICLFWESRFNFYLSNM